MSNRRRRNKKQQKAFSKTLLIQESILIWIISLSFIILAYISIINDYAGSLPWLTAMSSLPWTAYAVSQACYYNKSKVENRKNGIVYETAMVDIQNDNNDCPI